MAEMKREVHHDDPDQKRLLQLTINDDFSQPGVEAMTECQPLVIKRRSEDVQYDPYHDAYRNGNFGMKRGTINITRAKRWSVAHFFSAAFMTSFTLTCTVLLGNNHRYWIDYDLGDWFIAITILCCIFGLAMSSCSCYLLNSLAKIRRPLFFLLLVRLMAVLELVLLMTGIGLTIAVASEALERNPWRTRYGWYTTDDPRDIADNFKSFLVLSSFLVISMVVEVIMAGAWLFHWWKCCDCCEALKSFCVFEPGEPLAPCVSDPPTGIIQECAYVCLSIYKIDWKFIDLKV